MGLLLKADVNNKINHRVTLIINTMFSASYPDFSSPSFSKVIFVPSFHPGVIFIVKTVESVMYPILN